MKKRAPFDRGDLDLPVPKPRKAIPHAFVLESLDSVSPWTRPMFGCVAVYVAEKIVLILRDRPTYPEDNGVWLATTRDHHESLRRDFPSMRSIGVLGEEVTSWQVLPAEAADFEEAALRACEFILAGDARIGKVPQSRGRRPPKTKQAQKPVARLKRTPGKRRKSVRSKK